jgi:hypothetical protein
MVYPDLGRSVLAQRGTQAHWGGGSEVRFIFPQDPSSELLNQTPPKSDSCQRSGLTFAIRFSANERSEYQIQTGTALAPELAAYLATS